VAAENRFSRRQFVIGSAMITGAGLLTQTQIARAQTLLQAPAVVAQQKTLTLATLDGELSNGVTAQLPALQSKTGINVDLVKLPGADMQTKITADFSSGTGIFDVIVQPVIFLHSWAAAGFIQPLDDYTKADTTIDLPDFVPQLLSTYGMYQGNLIALPYKADVYVFFYRKDLFADPNNQADFKAKNGADLKVPDTVSELVTTAKYFTQKFNPNSPTQYGWHHMGAKGQNAYWIWASRLKVYGGDYLDQSFHPAFDNDAGRKAMDIASQLNECSPDDVASAGFDEVNAAFVAGKVAMVEQWPGLSKMAENPSGSMAGSSQIIGKTGYAVPAGDMVNGQLQKVAIGGGWAAAISKFAKDKDAAYQTVAFLTSKEAEPLKIPAGNDPCRTSTYQDPTIAAANPLYATTFQCLQAAKIMADIDAPPVSDQLEQFMGTTIHEVWAGQRTSDDALSTTSQYWVEVLQGAGLYQ
jgi:ABC-type glycerol-3-phosphate transport system substrate-binding protein